MRIDRHILHDAGHLAGFLPDITAENQDFSDRIRSLEIFAGDTFGDNHLVRSVQAALFISFQQFEVKEIEEVGLCIADADLAIEQFVVFHDLFRKILASDAGVILDGTHILLHGRGITGRRTGPIVRQLPILIEAGFDTENTILPAVHVVIAVFESHVRQDQQGSRHADRQTDYIDGAESFLFGKAAPRTVPIVCYYHGDKDFQR